MENYYNESDEGNPSEIFKKSWLLAFRIIGDYPIGRGNAGKYLIHEDYKNIDKVWKKIKLATENGLLGTLSKVATAKPNPNATNKKQSVICVYTYDGNDSSDRLRIRQELRNLGIERKIPYKSNEKTRQGLYKKNGDTNISDYFE